MPGKTIGQQAKEIALSVFAAVEGVSIENLDLDKRLSRVIRHKIKNSLEVHGLTLVVRTIPVGTNIGDMIGHVRIKIT